MMSSIASNRTCGSTSGTGGSAVVELIAVSVKYTLVKQYLVKYIVDFVYNHIIIMINVTVLLLS